MKAVIYLDVPDWQIGQDVSVYFPDTMLKHGKCELLKEQDNCENCAIAIEDRQPVVRCRDCKHFAETQMGSPRAEKRRFVCDEFNPPDDWFCADGERKNDGHQRD